MKNPFKTFRDLQAKVKEHDEFIKAQAGKKFIEAFESMKNRAFKEWEKENPPKFNYKDKVEVVVWDVCATANGKFPRTLYSGKIISIVRIDKKYAIDNWCDFFASRLSGKPSNGAKWVCKAERIYCIDAGDMKYHEAKESDIMFKFNTK